MNLWGATPLLAAVLLTGGHAGAKSAPTPHPASIAVSGAVLTQVGSGKWQTTLLLNGAVASKCPQRSDFTLETTAPDRVIPKPVASSAGTHVVTQAHRYCRRITLDFGMLNQIPASAVLILRAPGAAVTAIPVTFNRPVSLWFYLVLPGGIGLVMAGLLFWFAVAAIKVYNWCSEPVPRLTRDYWRYTVIASGAWTASDSWATNIAPIIGILAAAFGATTAASSLFPGVALDRFELVNLAAVTIIAVVPFAFSILYAKWTAKNPGPSADSAIVPQVPLPKALAEGAGFLPVGAKIWAPVGAAIALTGGASIGASEPVELIGAAVTGELVEIAGLAETAKRLKNGAIIPLPAGAKVDIYPGRSIALPGGSDVLVAGPSALRISTDDGARLLIPADQFPPAKTADPHAPVHETPADDGPSEPLPDTTLPSPAWVVAPSGAKVTANGVANLWLPAGTQMEAPRRNCPPLPTDRHLLVPQGSNTMVANMGLVIVSALMTIFGIGIQVGIAGVLAFGYSDANTAGRWIALGLIAATALFTLYYSTTAMRTLADPQPGSSLSAVSGTSFTL